MNLVFFLKSLSENALYFSLAGLILSWFGVPLEARIPLLLIALAGALCRAADKLGRVRYAPLALLPLCFFFARSLPAAAVLLPPMAFTVFSVYRRLFFPQHTDSVDAFRRGLLSAALLAAASLFGSWRAVSAVSLPLFVVFLTSGVLMLRMLRHEEETLRRPRFVWLNALLVAAVLALGVLLGTPAALRGLFSFVGLIYRGVIVPILLCVVYLLAWVALLIAKLISRLRGEVPKQAEETVEEFAAGMRDYLGEVVPREPSAVFQNAMLGLFVLAAVIGAVLYFKRRLSRLRAAETGGVREARTLAAPYVAPRAPRELFTPRDPRRAVRWHYRRFLALYRKLGGHTPPTCNSADIARGAAAYFPAQQVAELRELYLQARYSEADIPRAAAERAAAQYKTLKHNTGEEQ